MKLFCAIAIAIVASFSGVLANAADTSSIPEPAIIRPTGSVPALGYQVTPDFFKYPPGFIIGEASGVAVNSKGHIFLFQRAKPMLSEFDGEGNYVRSLGEGFFDHPHGLRIDKDDNIWTTDDTNNTVLKLNPEGRLLFVLGKRQPIGGEADWLFNKPSDVAFGPHGEIYVADGYGNSRVVKFGRHGDYIGAWGKYGSKDGEFMLPHSIAVDAAGRVYVGDRENARIQIFDGDGRFLTKWVGIGYPYGLMITSDQHVWMADGGYDRIVELDPKGHILGAFGEPGHEPGQMAWAHFMAMTADQKIIVADVLNWRFQLFTPLTPTGAPASYIPTERRFFGFTPSEGYVFRSPGWPVKPNDPYSLRSREGSPR